MSYTRAQKYAALERELAFRHRVYPKQIALGRLSKEEAARQIAMFEAILADYCDQPKLLEELRP